MKIHKAFLSVLKVASSVKSKIYSDFVDAFQKEWKEYYSLYVIILLNSLGQKRL